MVTATCSENAEEGILLYAEIQSVFQEGWKASAQCICIPTFMLPTWPRMPSPLFSPYLNLPLSGSDPVLTLPQGCSLSTHPPMILETSLHYSS